MSRFTFLLGTSFALLGTVAVTASNAATLRSPVAVNNGAHVKTPQQPEGGAEFNYKIAIEEGDLAGCTIDVTEALYGRDEGAWGIFDIKADLTCPNGGFSYSTSGAWDGNGFHAAGAIDDGSGHGDHAGASGRIAQLGGGVAPKDDGTLDIFFELVVETAE